MAERGALLGMLRGTGPAARGEDNQEGHGSQRPQDLGRKSRTGERARLSKLTVTDRALKLADANGQSAARPAVGTQLLFEHEKRKEAARRAAENMLEILRGAGFDAQHASEIARRTLWTGIMLVLGEPGYHPELSGDERAEWQRRNQIELAMLPRRQASAARGVRGADDPVR